MKRCEHCKHENHKPGRCNERVCDAAGDMDDCPCVYGTIRLSVKKHRPAPRIVDTVQNELAKELHRQYRAAEKALAGRGLKHDHGWDGCHVKSYFWHRANLILKRANVRNPRTLGEAEEALQNTVLVRRLIVTGKAA